MMFLLLVGGTSLFAQDNTPKIEFEKSQHDFGDIDKGEKVTTVFKFKNTGSAPLEIMDVSTSCGCTSAKPSKIVYEPGEEGEIPVTFNSTRFSGKVSKTVTVVTNAHPSKVAVIIKGNVVVDVVSDPKNVFFPKARMGRQQEQKIRVSTSKMEKLEINDLRAEPEFLQVSMERINDKTAELTLVADGTKFPKSKPRLTGQITYTTNSKTQKDMRTSVTINIAQPIRVSPGAVYFFSLQVR